MSHETYCVLESPKHTCGKGYSETINCYVKTSETSFLEAGTINYCSECSELVYSPREMSVIINQLPIGLRKGKNFSNKKDLSRFVKENGLETLSRKK